MSDVEVGQVWMTRVNKFIVVWRNNNYAVGVAPHRRDQALPETYSIKDFKYYERCDEEENVG